MVEGFRSDPHHLADVANDPSGSVSAEGSNRCDMFNPIFTDQIIADVVAPCRLEINIDIWSLGGVFWEEAIEVQIMLVSIDARKSKAICQRRVHN